MTIPVQLMMCANRYAAPSGNLYAWGEGSSGEIGDGLKVDYSSPVQVGSLAYWSKMASGGSGHGGGIRTDGTLWMHGGNDWGQLGDGTTIERVNPIQIGTNTNWVEISCGTTHTMAIDSDGKLWGWGNGAYGRTGHSNTTNYSSPVQIGALTDWSKVLGTGVGSIMLKTDGTVWTTGEGSTGELGDGTAVDKSSPVQVGALTTWTGIGAAYRTSFAIKNDGTLWGWGRNTEGAVGDSTTTVRSSPVQVGAATNWSSVGGGLDFVIGRTTDGKLWGWGDNSPDGALGIGTTTNMSSPSQIGSLTDWGDVQSMGLNNYWAAVIKTDGTWWAWGLGNEGQLGDGTTVSKSSPIQIGARTDYLSIGAYNAGQHVIVDDGSLIYTGADNTIADGRGSSGGNVSSPVQVGNHSPFVSISVGRYEQFAVALDGTLWAHGRNTATYALGDGTTANKSFPVQIGAAITWSKTVTGADASSGIDTSGQLYTWGEGWAGKMGNGATTNHTVPTQVGVATDWTEVGWAQSAGFAINSAGKLYSWGYNVNGQLGHGNTTSLSTPTQVGALTDWSKVWGGHDQMIAVKTDGTLWVCGEGLVGQLGDGTTANKSSPVQVGALTNWLQGAMGDGYGAAINTDGELFAWGNATGSKNAHPLGTNVSSPVQVGSLVKWAQLCNGGTGNMAIRTDGTLWGWGENGQNQLGLGASTIDMVGQIQVGVATDWSEVNIINASTSAITTTGKLYTWGINNSGMLGNGSTAHTSTPAQVGALTDWASCSMSGNHTAALKTDGTIWTWGDANPFGGTGHGDTTDRSSPVQVGASTTWTKITAGNGNCGAIDAGKLYTWGKGGSGGLGNGSTANISAPAQVGSDTDWSDVLMGDGWGLALKTTGTLWSWGAGTNGILGTGTTTGNSSPVQVGALTDWGTTFDSQNYNKSTMAIVKPDGTLWAWGRGTSGQLGDGTTVSKSSPVQIGARTDWSKATAGSVTSHFMDTAGIMYGTGAGGANGLIGNGTINVSYSSPVQVGSHSKIVSVSIGTSFNGHGVFKRLDGTIWAWGLNTAGRLGDSTTVSKSFPVQIGIDTDWIAGYAGDSFSAGLKAV